MSRPTPRRALPLVALAALLACASAHADDATRRAKDAYRQATSLYNVGEYAQALEQFKAAYLSQPDPAFLFNIGQCQRQLGQYEAALKSYRAFLREGANMPAATRTEVQRLIGEMEKAVAESRANQPPLGTRPPSEETAPAPVTEPPKQATPEPPPPSPPPVAAPAPAPQPTAERTPVYKKWWLWTIVGVVVAGGVIGAAVGATAGSGPWATAPDVGPGRQALVGVHW